MPERESNCVAGMLICSKCQPLSLAFIPMGESRKQASTPVLKSFQVKIILDSVLGCEIVETEKDMKCLL